MARARGREVMTGGNGEADRTWTWTWAWPGEDEGLSGRRFVIGMAAVVLVVWVSLFVAFRLWRAHYRERAEFGAAVVASAVDPLASVVPADVRPDDWRRAVGQTHAMLDGVSRSNLLGRDQMAALGGQIRSRVASTRPETARATLMSLWDDMEREAGPVVTAHHPRPKPLRANPQP